MNYYLKLFLFGLLIVNLNACALQHYDYTEYKNNPPKSILVMPPLNDSTEVDASYKYLSTLTRPLAEAGYYVFPVAVVTEYMKGNGLPTPGEMNRIPLTKIKEIFNPDSVLYTNIEQWGQKYMIISSKSVVRAKLKLVDVDTGKTLWEGTAKAEQDSSNSNSGLAGLLISAVISQMIESKLDNSHKISHQANRRVIFAKTSGLPFGPYHPENPTDPRAH